jgi:tetratricopeptide (TPR) repeat protein
MKLAIVLLLALQGPSPEVMQHVQAGMEARRQGHTAEAIAEFKKVTELEPALAIAFVNLGAAYMENHDYGAAIPPLQRALELDGNLVGAHQMLGYALLAQGYAAKAIPHLERAQAFDALGIAQLETGNLPEAITNLEAALAKRPNDPDLLYYLQRATGLLSKQFFDALVSGDAQSARAHEALAESYAMLRRMPDAEREFHEALRLRPDTPGIQSALGDLYSSAAQWTKAEAAFRAEAKLRPGDAQAAYGLGWALLQQGKVHEARLELQRADTLRPDMPETLYALGKASLLDSDDALAEKAWTRVISIEDDGDLAMQAHFGLAGLYRRQGKVPAADHEMEAFKKLKAASQGNPIESIAPK